MKKLMALVALGFAAPALAQAPHYTQGYVTQNGTYVAPHYSTNPNSTIMDNYSTRGNVNPYTGQAGTVNPYGSPRQYSSPSYSPETLMRNSTGGRLRGY